MIAPKRPAPAPLPAALPVVAPRVTGLAHIFAATGYSLSGLRRLGAETAFRHEVAALIASVAMLALVGASAVDMAVLLGLFLLLVAVEALNTAIECVVDLASPEWSASARDAKDLGSLAVMCMICATGLFVAVTVARHLLFV